MKKIVCILAICMFVFTSLLFSGCTPKGKYFVDSKYIISYASLTGTEQNLSTGETTYMVDIIHESDITLNYLKYKCELYKNNEVIETLEGEVSINGLYARYIPLKTTKEYDHAKVVCTGWSDENPANFVRLNAMGSSEMLQCKHNNLIDAKYDQMHTNSKRDFMIIYYTSNTAYGEFRFFYETFSTNINSYDMKVCLDCGYYEV